MLTISLLNLLQDLPYIWTISILSNNFYFFSKNFQCIELFTKGQILHWYKLKAFVDDKINDTENLKFVMERVENIVGK